MEYFQQVVQLCKKYFPLVKRHSHLALPMSVGILFLFGSLSLLYGTLVVPNFSPKVSAVSNEIQKTYQKVTASNDSDESSVMVVDIAGAIEKPGIYTLQKGDRLSILIEKSGGFHKKADKSFIARQVNLSQKLSDQQKVYIPFQGEKVVSMSVPQLSNGGSSVSNGSQLVNVNSASESELDSLEGIGQARAQQIIAGRPFASLEELVERKILSQKLFEQLQNKLGI